MSESIVSKLVTSCSDEELEKLRQAIQDESEVRQEKQQKAGRPWTAAEWKKLLKLRNNFLDSTEWVETSVKLTCSVECSVEINYDCEEGVLINILNPNAVLLRRSIEEYLIFPYGMFETLPEVKRLIAGAETAMNKYHAEVQKVATKYKLDERNIKQMVEDAL